MAGVAQGRAALSEQAQLIDTTTQYRLRRDSARTWAVDRRVKRNGDLEWTGWKWGSLEAMARLFLHLSMPEAQALTCFEQIAGVVAAAETRVLTAVEQALTVSPAGELVLEL